MKQGIPVPEAASFLNVSTNYIYRLVREEELEPAGKEPLLISGQSVTKRLMKLTPFLESAFPSRLDYAVRQHEISGW